MSGLGQVRDRIPHELRIVERQNVAPLGDRIHCRELTQNAGEVALRARVVVIPLEVDAAEEATTTAPTGPVRRVSEAHEGEPAVVRHVELFEVDIVDLGCFTEAPEPSALLSVEIGGRQHHERCSRDGDHAECQGVIDSSEHRGSPATDLGRPRMPVRFRAH